MLNFLRKNQPPKNSFFTSELFDETTFYKNFINDLENCQKELIIESPFITSSRMKTLYPILKNLVTKKVKVYIITRSPQEHEGSYVLQSELEIQRFEHSGIQVLLCDGNHHRKLAILDRKILYEGSLNILSQTKSREIMRRISEESVVLQTFKFLNFDRIF
jgi:phosphatidylserine/phosphatidylglycerophosphate/cardiolipin synthase-like enzyme